MIKRVKMTCPRCGYEWESKSQMFLVSCPRCGNKVKKEKTGENGARDSP